MSQMADFDILIIGSGPSGANAATEAVRSGFKVGLLEIGFTDTQYQHHIPQESFSNIRKTDSNQANYFLGSNPAAAFQSQAKAGDHLTPPRQHMIQDMESLFPTESKNFVPLQSTAHGGLGVSWGSNVFAFEDFELRKIGLPIEEIRQFYSLASAEIGISGPKKDDLSGLIAGLGNHAQLQPPLEIDTNAKSIFTRYVKNRSRFLSREFFLGQAVLAVLSKNLKNRESNPYWDMDFWSDHRKSVYRPKYTLEELRDSPNFSHLPGKQALRFASPKINEPVQVFYRDIYSKSHGTLTCKKLILAAGAINSGKLALSSINNHGIKIPILCNPNHWVAAIHWPMLGKPAQDPRYSLAQLTALMRIPEDPEDYVLGQFYSYRSLLYSRLLSNIPLPPKLGLLFLRLMITSFTCVNLHFSDRPSPLRWLSIKKERDQDILTANYERTEAEEKNLRRNERRFVRNLLALGCIPMGINRPAHGASIHYAGTLPYSKEDRPLTCSIGGKLRGFHHVYVGDGASWRFLPAKGLTYTLIANARRIAAEAVKDLRNPS